MFFAKRLNKQYTAQSRVCFSAWRSFSLEGGTEKAEMSVREEEKGGGYLILKMYMYI